MENYTIQTDANKKLSEFTILTNKLKNGGDGTEIGKVIQMRASDTTEQLGDFLEEISELKQIGYIIENNPLENISITKLSQEDRIANEIKIKSAQKKLDKVEIQSLTLNITPDDLITKIAVVDITSPENSGSHTINDPALGPTKPNDICATCKRGQTTCPGHLGKISLDKIPIYNPIYVRQIISILQCLCSSCGALVISPEILNTKYKINLDIPTNIRLKMIEDYTRKIITSGYVHCRSKEDGVKKCEPHDIYNISNKDNYKKKGIIEYSIYDSDKSDKSEKKTYDRLPESTLKIFEGLENNYPEDLKLLGLGDNKPSDLIMRSLMVLSPIKRGVNLFDTGIESDRLGTKYMEIIKLVNNLKDPKYQEKQKVKKNKKKKIGYNKSIPTERDLRSKLFLLVSNLLTSDTSGDSSKYGKSSQTSISEELSGKKGLFRGQLMSSRINFSARTVIGPGPNLQFGQVGIPQAMAKYLTVPVVVANFNIASLTKLIRNGRATHIIKGSDGYSITINDINKTTIDINIGETVERWLQDGDYLTFNRQPTLHKQGIRGMSVKLHDALTITTHLSDTTGFNADYDGDEMNLHMAQTLEAIVEVSTLMKNELCIANEQNSAPIIGLVMDNILAAYLLTLEDDIMSVSLWNDCLTRITAREDLGTFDKRRKEQGVRQYSGRALFSALLPAEFYYKRGGVEIINGIMVAGVIKKAHIGPTANSIIQELYMNPLYGIPRTAKFLTDGPWVLNQWLSSRGFTVGIKDCIVPKEIKELVKTEIAKARMLIDDMDELIDNPFEDQKREGEIMVILGKIREKIGATLNSIPGMKNNAFSVIISSGSKGSLVNLAQVLGLVGQQTAWGARIPKSLSGGMRSLPHFTMNENSLESRGLVVNSFAEGLTAQEYFFHAYASRESILNTAMDTSKIGDIRRDLFKMMEDFTIQYDGSVRNAAGNIVQYIYGDDGFSASNLRRVQVKNIEMFLPVDFQQLADELNIKYGSK